MKCICEIVELKNKDVVVTSGCGDDIPVLTPPCEIEGVDDV